MKDQKGKEKEKRGRRVTKREIKEDKGGIKMQRN